ncbi:MAG: nuclear transport factor 2 family protein [Sphingomonas bacterium]|jgi:hypothetical protein|uniref:nuclear transport factor 2 family protein n=1 Tax=Sphingomonas bacterium TaxID=1895847 RepID=UPI002634A07E|nr:nuclear transport factor 2 family protein [Sphingomonas bacterium]MDB5703859.1 nuclear transport factor 2 family protein [Sphingomonas bacterium]
MSDPTYTRLSADDHSALVALCMEYCYLADNYQSARIPELFTEDATWQAPGTSMNGRAEMVTGWAERQKVGELVTRRHMVSNYRFTVDDDGTVRGILSFTLYRAPRGEHAVPVPMLVADHVDTYEKQSDGRWLFKTREVVPLMPNNWVAPRTAQGPR